MVYCMIKAVLRPFHLEISCSREKVLMMLKSHIRECPGHLCFSITFAATFVVDHAVFYISLPAIKL